MEKTIASREMHIAFIADENNVLPLLTALVSMRDNRAPDSLCRVHVLCCGVSEENRARLESTGAEGITVETVVPESTAVPGKEACDAVRLPETSLCLFRLAELFPALDRLLYLDSDILVLKDLAELYGQDICGGYAAVVTDPKMTARRPELARQCGGACFDPGVMLLDLARIRADGLAEKLTAFRADGIRSNDDRATLNAAFGGKVRLLPLRYNTGTLTLGSYTAAQLKERFETGAATKADIVADAVILHLTTPYKPWKYRNAPFAELWRTYYRRLEDAPAPREDGIGWQALHVALPEGTCGSSRTLMGIEKPVIVTLTSYPARIGFVARVVRSMLKQTVLPDKILLWLAKTQFPNGDGNLPDELKRLAQGGIFEIRLCAEDLRPHKKYFYALRQYPEAILITVDDDKEYPPCALEQLLTSYRLFPTAVSARLTHAIAVSDDGTIAPYAEWERDVRLPGFPSRALIAVGCGGVLYPPHCMDEKETLDRDAIVSTCLNADDLWLKVMEVRHGTPVVNAAAINTTENIPGSQEDPLWHQNARCGGNDPQLERILERFDACPDGTTVTERIAADRKTLGPLLPAARELGAVAEENRRLKDRMAALEATNGYRLAAKLSGMANRLKKLKSSLFRR